MLKAATTGMDPNRGRIAHSAVTLRIVGYEHARVGSRAVDLAPLKLDVGQVWHGRGERPSQPNASVVVYRLHACRVELDAHVGRGHQRSPPVRLIRLLAAERGEADGQQHEDRNAPSHRTPPPEISNE